MRQRPVSSYRWVIQGTLLPMHIAIGLNFMAPAPLFPLVMEHYDINRGAVSLLVVAVTVVLTMFLVPGGILVARMGPRKAIAVGGLLVGTGILVPLATSFWMVVVLRAVFGIGVGIVFPATSAVVVQWFRQSEMPVMNGINLAGQTAGVATSMFIAVPLANVIGWQMVFLSFGALPLIALAAWLVAGRSTPVLSAPAAPFGLRDVPAILTDRNTLLLALAAVGPFAVFVGFSSWLPSYYHEVLGMSLSQAGAMVAILPLMGVFVNPLSGLLQAKVGRRKPFLLVPGLIFPVAALGTFLFFDHPIPIAAFAVLLGLCFSAFIPALLTIPMELPGITMERVAVVTAAALTMGNAATVVSPLLIGALTDAFGSYLPSLIAVAFAPLLLVPAALALPETGPKATKRGPVVASAKSL